MFVFSVVLSVINCFYGRQRNMSSNTRCSGLSRQRGYSTLVWPARSPDLNPIENVWDALGRQVAGQNYPPTNKNTLIRSLTEEWDKLPQHKLRKVWYDVWNVASHSTVDISCTDTFL
ncbi:hypothetical protein TNCV_1411751 [Trichonephila clavipes]|nr:hypothetical protein TNCV_1411751 [Trichonephila clavipes]